MSFDIEKDESALAIAHDEINRCVPVHFFNGELTEGRAKRRGEGTVAGVVDPGPRSVLRDERHGTGLGRAQQIVKNKNRKEGIGRRGEVQCDGSCHQGTASIQPVQIDIQRDASALNDHLLKCAARRVRSFLFGLGCVISCVAAEQ